jgi:hypothetical protein
VLPLAYKRVLIFYIFPLIGKIKSSSLNDNDDVCISSAAIEESNDDVYQIFTLWSQYAMIHPALGQAYIGAHLVTTFAYCTLPLDPMDFLTSSILGTRN